jgi:hypothetical protein
MSELDAAVAARLAVMPLARLAHFTPSRNLPHIVADERLRSTRELASDVRACYAQTDLDRLDGYPDKICCSLQYPNGFYFAHAKSKRAFTNYPDWVCLLIDKSVAATRGTLFCARNAAASSAGCLPGVLGLESCYAESVIGQGGHTWRRGARHDPASPTDVQAEVLVTSPIPLSAVSAIVVPTEEAAEQENARLVQLGLAPPQHIQWRISPGMFDKYKIAAAVCNSNYFTEAPWEPTGVNRR